jgi:hypothetical protein
MSALILNIMWRYTQRLLLVLLLLSFAGVSSYLYFFGFDAELKFGDPLEELPAQTLALLRIDRPGALLDALDNQPNVRELLGTDPVLSQWMTALRQVPQENHPNSWVKELDVLIAVVPEPNSLEPALIWGIGLPTGLSDRQAIDQFEQLFLQRAEKTNTINGTAFTFQTSPPCLGIIQNDAMFLSTSEEVLQFIHNPENPKLINLEGFMEAWGSKGSADVNCIVNLKEFPLEYFAPQITPSSQLANWTCMDVKLRNQGVEVNGVFFSDEKQRLSGSSSAPIPSNMMELLPTNAEQIVLRAWNSPMDFAEQVQNWSGKTVYTRDELSRKRWFEHCLSWTDNGIAQFELENHSYVVIGLGDSILFENEMQTLSDFGQSGLGVYHWKSDSLWQAFMPSPYNIASTRAMILGEWVVLCESQQALENYLAYSHRRQPNPFMHAELAIGKPQIYANSSLSYFGGQLKGAWKSYWENHGAAWTKLAENMHFTAYPENNHTYFRWRLESDSLAVKGPNIEWQQQIAGEIDDALWIRDHRSGEYYALVISKESLFALDARGVARWSLNLSSPIVSKPQEIDLYKNGKVQIIFNTEDAIHCLDVKGRQIEGFPIQLNSASHTPMAIFDYDDNRDYRFLIATDDGQIHNYQKEGKATNGWKYSKSSSKIKMLKHLKAGARDYIFTLSEDGTIELLKRNGQPRYTSDLKIPGDLIDIQFEMTNDIATSRVIFADSNGQILDKTFGNGSKGKMYGLANGQFILIEDLDNDRVGDMLVIDGKDLSIFDSSGQKFMQSANAFEPDIAPAIYRFDGGKQIGLVSSSLSLVTIVSQEGTERNGFPIQGKTLPSLRDADNDGKLELLTTAGNGTVLCYELE